MKYYLLAVILLSQMLQAQQCEWARAYAGFSQQVRPQKLVRAANGDLLASGTYARSGRDGIFLTRLDSLGNLLWSDTLSEKIPCCAPADAPVLYESQNKTWWAGNYSDTLMLNGILLEATAVNNFFLASLNASGSVDSISTFHHATVADLIVTKNNDLVFLCTYNDTATLYGHSFSSPTHYGLFLARVRNGQVISSIQADGKINYAYKVRELSNGDLVAGGRFEDTLTVDTTQYVGAYTDFLLKTDSMCHVKKFQIVLSYTSLVQNVLVDGTDKIKIMSSDCWTPGCVATLNIYNDALHSVGQKWFPHRSYGSFLDFRGSFEAENNGLWCWGHDFESGNYGVNGDEWMNMQLMKLDSAGNILLKDTFPVKFGQYSFDWHAKDITVAGNIIFVTAHLMPDDTLFIQQFTLVNTSTEEEMFIAKFNTAQNTSAVVEGQSDFISFYPNPSTGKVQWTGAPSNVKVFDHLGNEVRCSWEKNEIMIPTRGLYFLEYDLKGRVYRKKIVIQ